MSIPENNGSQLLGERKNHERIYPVLPTVASGSPESWRTHTPSPEKPSIPAHSVVNRTYSDSLDRLAPTKDSPLVYPLHHQSSSDVIGERNGGKSATAFGSREPPKRLRDRPRTNGLQLSGIKEHQGLPLNTLANKLFDQSSLKPISPKTSTPTPEHPIIQLRDCEAIFESIEQLHLSIAAVAQQQEMTIDALEALRSRLDSQLVPSTEPPESAISNKDGDINGTRAIITNPNDIAQPPEDSAPTSIDGAKYCTFTSGVASNHPSIATYVDPFGSKPNPRDIATLEDSHEDRNANLCKHPNIKLADEVPRSTVTLPGSTLEISQKENVSSSRQSNELFNTKYPSSPLVMTGPRP